MSTFKTSIARGSQRRVHICAYGICNATKQYSAQPKHAGVEWPANFVHNKSLELVVYIDRNGLSCATLNAVSNVYF